MLINSLSREARESIDAWDQPVIALDPLSFSRRSEAAAHQVEETFEREPANTGGEGREREPYRYCCDYLHSLF